MNENDIFKSFQIFSLSIFLRKKKNDRKEEARNKRREEDKSVAGLEEVCLALGLSEATATTAADGGRYGINA